jgi:hypothetical protein
MHQFNHEAPVNAQNLEKRCTFASFLAIAARSAKIDALLQLSRWNSQTFLYGRENRFLQRSIIEHRM